MTYAELVAAYFERSDAIQNLWTLYVVVIGGLLAVAAVRRERDVVGGLLATALYCAFAYRNLDGIHDAAVQRYAILDAIRRSPTPSDNPAAASIGPTLSPPAYPTTRNVHVGCDVLTVATVWAFQARRHRRPAARTA